MLVSCYDVSVSTDQLRNNCAECASEIASLTPKQQKLHEVALYIIAAACNSLQQQGAIDADARITIINQTYGVSGYGISRKDHNETFWLLDEIIELYGNDFKNVADLFQDYNDRFYIREFVARCNIEQTHEPLSFCSDDFMSQLQMGVDIIMDNCLQLINQTSIEPERHTPYRYIGSFSGGYGAQLHANSSGLSR